MTFDRTAGYIADTMNLPEVKKYMQGSKFKVPLYMVMGLNITRGGSLDASSRQGQGLRMEGGLNPLIIPAELGLKLKTGKEKKEDESWERSTDPCNG